MGDGEEGGDEFPVEAGGDQAPLTDAQKAEQERDHKWEDRFSKLETEANQRKAENEFLRGQLSVQRREAQSQPATPSKEEPRPMFRLPDKTALAKRLGTNEETAESFLRCYVRVWQPTCGTNQGCRGPNHSRATHTRHSY